MSQEAYTRVGSVIAQILARMVLTQPATDDPDEEVTGDADHRVRPSVDRRPG